MPESSLASLGAYLSATVPFLIHELSERQGPTTGDFTRLFAFRDSFFLFGADNMMFSAEQDRQEKRKTPSADRCESQRLWGEMAFAVAVLAFFPGGIQFAGTNFCAGAPDSTGKRSECVGVFPITQRRLLSFWNQDGAMMIHLAFTAASKTKSNGQGLQSPAVLHVTSVKARYKRSAASSPRQRQSSRKRGGR